MYQEGETAGGRFLDEQALFQKYLGEDSRGWQSSSVMGDVQRAHHLSVVRILRTDVPAPHFEPHPKPLVNATEGNKHTFSTNFLQLDYTEVVAHSTHIRAQIVNPLPVLVWLRVHLKEKDHWNIHSKCQGAPILSLWYQDRSQAFLHFKLHSFPHSSEAGRRDL